MLKINPTKPSGNNIFNNYQTHFIQPCVISVTASNGYY